MRSNRRVQTKQQSSPQPSLTRSEARRLSERLGSYARTGFMLENTFEVEERILDAPYQAAFSALDLRDQATATVVFCDNQLVWHMIKEWQSLASMSRQLKQVVACGELAGTHYAVYQGLRSDETLLQDIQVEGLEQVTGIVRKLGKCLHVLHSDNFIYGDLSPDNVAISSDTGEVILMGPLFRHMSGYFIDSEQDLLPLADLYGPGEFVSPQAYGAYWPYVAPEVCIGDFSPHSDIFSLGAILYWLVVGGDVSFATSPSHQSVEPSPTTGYAYCDELNALNLQEAFFRQKLMGPLRRFAGFCDKMPSVWQDFFEKSLSGHISFRYDNIDAFLIDFEKSMTPKSAMITVTQEGTGDEATKSGAKPLRDIRVTLRRRGLDLLQIMAPVRYESVTDRDGQCVISGIVPGDYMLEAQAVRSTDFEPRGPEIMEIYENLEYHIELRKLGIMERLFKRS